MTTSVGSNIPRRVNAVMTVISRHRLLLLQFVWVIIAVATLVVLLAGIPVYFDRLHSLAVSDFADPTAFRRGLANLGLTASTYATWVLLLEVGLALGFIALGLVIVARKPHEPMALFVSLTLIVFGATVPRIDDALIDRYSNLSNPVMLLNAAGFIAFFVCCYVFPDGRFVPGWTIWLVPLWIIEESGHFLLDQSSTLGVINFALFFVLIATCVYAQIHRYRRISTFAQRQQTKWVLLGFVIAILGFLGYGLSGALPKSDTGVVLHDLIAGSLMIVCFWLLLGSIAISILRYQLWDIDIVINRTLVYGALTGGVILSYVLVVGALGAVFQVRGNLIISLLATGMVAVIFQPLRERLQQAVNRLMYGERDDPYAVLSRLGRRLEETLAPDPALASLVETIRGTLKLPYAAISFAGYDGHNYVAESGSVTDGVLRLPLVHQQEPIGELILAPRSPEESFRAGDQRLLEDLARQIGIAAHNMRLVDQTTRLNRDLQRSRERLVTSREEERRRLRRDLHDGLAPTLAALNLKAGQIKGLVRSTPDAAERLLDEWRAEIRGTIHDVRSLAYELRPPILDELGLVAAIHERAAAISTSTFLVTVDSPAHLGQLPAAVEVAAYRITQEALVNVERHARARSCGVRLWLSNEPVEMLCIEIVDDGIGLPNDAPHRSGVGLLSIRERTAELGGSCVIGHHLEGGTRVMASLPIMRE